MGPRGQEREIAVPIAEMVFGSLETPPAELPPLSDAIDLDALEKIVPTGATPEATVAFSNEGLDVFVHSDPTICVRSGDEVVMQDEDATSHED